MLAVPAKKYVVLREFRRTDPRTGIDAVYVPDSETPYMGPVDKPYFLDSEGPDGKGPLLAEGTNPAPPSSPSDSAGDSGKEK